jgi:hypothetical protein
VASASLSGRGIVRIHLEPVQRADVIGLPIRLRGLWVSVTERRALAAALTG